MEPSILVGWVYKSCAPKRWWRFVRMAIFGLASKNICLPPLLRAPTLRFKQRNGLFCAARKKRNQQEAGANEETEKEVATSDSGKPIGWSFLPKEVEDTSQVTEKVETGGDAEDDSEDGKDVRASYELISPQTNDIEDLPSATRDQILTACTSVSTLIFAAGFLVRGFAEHSPDIMGSEQSVIDTLLTFEPHWDGSDIAFALIIAAIVTGARKSLMYTWKDFAIATNRSNKQVLQELGGLDIVFISFLPGISEEFFFRANLIPALYPDWRGAVIAGVAFGILHNTGGRNWSFSAWASAVGTLYGISFLMTQNMYVPMLAHSFSNLASAYLWLGDSASNSSE